MSRFITCLLIANLLLLTACKDDEGTGNACSATFDQKAMFTNIADGIILPAYQNLKLKVDAMAAQAQVFTANANVQELDSLRSTFLAAYESWQYAAQFEFGPAEEVFLRSSLNNFPLDTAQVQSNVSSASWDFNQPDRFDKGFPAIDYLLYGLSDVVTDFNNDDRLKSYLTALVTDIKSRTDHTLEGWNNGYKNTFINNTGTAAGTSLSLVINALNQNYELIKREKLGVPSGVLTLGFANPDKVEAYYSGHSAVLLLLVVEATQQLYLGVKSDGSEGLGLDDYLVAAKAEKNNQSLSVLINNQFSTIISTIYGLVNLNTPLSEIIENDQDTVVNAYNEVTKNLVNIKTDMPSVLCVSITYIDNPSDSD